MYSVCIDSIFDRMLIRLMMFLVVLSVSVSAQAQSDSSYAVLKGHSDDVESVAVSRSGELLATGSWDNTVQVFGTDSTFPHKQTLYGHRAAVSALAFSELGDILVTGGNDFRLLIWERDLSGEYSLKKELNQVHSAGINDVKVGRNSDMIFSCGDDGKIVVYSIGRDQKWVIDNKLPVNSIAIKGRNYILCADESPVAKLYSVTGRLIKEFVGHKDVINSVDFKGDMVVTGSSDKTAIVWDVMTGKQRMVLSGHTWKINSVDISNDGDYIVTGSSDGSTKVWDIASGDEIKSFSEPVGIIRQVAMSQDMHYIFSAYQVDDEAGNPTYGLSVWKTGMAFKFTSAEIAQNIRRVRQLREEAIAKAEADKKEVEQQRKQEAQEQPKPQVVKDTYDIQITIEDE